MKRSKIALALLCFLLIGCKNGSNEPVRIGYAPTLQGFNYFKPKYLDIEMLIPNESDIEENNGGNIYLRGNDYQYSVGEIINHKKVPSLESIVEGFCTSSNKPSEIETMLYEVKNEFGHWIRFETNCPRNEAARDIMVARLGTGTYLLTLLDGTTPEMAEKIERAFLETRKR